MEDVTVGIIEKSGTEEVRVILSEWKGRTNLNIRIFANYAIHTDPRTPTKKGVVMGVKHLPAFAKLVNEALGQAAELGLLEPVDTDT